MKNLFLSESRGFSDFVIEIDQKYVHFKDDNIFGLADDLELLQESYFLSNIFNKRPLQFSLEYIPSILKAKEQSLSVLISRISSPSADRKTQSPLDTIDKIFSFDRFCANNDAVVEFPPLRLLSLTRNTKIVTKWLLTVMAILPRSKRINNFLATTIAYLKPYSLLFAVSTDLMSVKKLLNELQKKINMNSNEQTFEDLIKVGAQSFEGEKTAEFWQAWKISANEILLDKPHQKDILEYATSMKATELSKEAEGAVFGGLAFLFDLRDALCDTKNTGITNLLRKVAIAQAFLAKVRVTLSRFCKKGRKFGAEKLFDFPCCLEPSYVDWVSEIAADIENATKEETEVVEEFSLALYDFVKFGSAYLRHPIKDPLEFCLVSSQALQEKFEELQKKLISPSKNNQIFASFSFLLQSITRYVLKCGRDPVTIEKRENLSQAQRWLLRSFKVLLRNHLQLGQPLSEHFVEFILEVVSFAQDIVLSLNIKQHYDTHFNTCYFIYIQVLVSQIEKCLETFKIEAIFSKTESALFELYDSEFLLGFDFSIQYTKGLRSIRLLWIYYYLSKLASACIGDKTQKIFLENPLIGRNSDKMMSMILNSQLFQRLALKKELFKKYEFVFLATRLHLTSIFQQIARKQEMTPIYLERLESNKIFESFLDFVCDFYQERWEKFADIPFLLCLSRSPKFEKKYLLQGGMIESCIISFFEGNSCIPFRVNPERVVDWLEKHFLIGEKDELSPKRFHLLNSITTCHKIVIYIIQQKYDKLEALVKQLGSGYQIHRDYKKLLISLHRERYYVNILATFIKKFANTIDIPQQVIETNRLIKIKWISQPWMVLYSDSKYTELCADIELGVTKSSEITENLALNYDQYIKIQSETSQMDFNTIEILKDERIIELFKHFHKTENFKTDYFYETFSLDSLKFVHYLHFALNHSVCGQTPWFMLGYEWAKTKLPVLSSMIMKSISVHGISFENFLIASLRIFLKLSEKYFEALCHKEGSAVDYEKSYKQITSTYINGNTLVKFIKYIWNCLNLCFIVYPEHKAWDNIPVFEELEEIGMEDISDKFTLAKKIFKNHVISKFFELALKNIASLVRNQRLISLRIIQRAESLGKFFNWIIALESQVEIFGQIEKKEKKVWFDILGEIMKESFFKRAILNKDFGTEDSERFTTCITAFDEFFGMLPELVKKSLLFLSDSASFGEMLIALYKSLVAESKDSTFKNNTEKKKAFLWTLFKLRSSVAFSAKNKEYEQLLLTQGLPMENTMQFDELMTSNGGLEKLMNENLANLVAEVGSSCGFLEKEEPALYHSIRKLLMVNFIYKSYLIRPESDPKKRLEMFFALSTFLKGQILTIRFEQTQKIEANNPKNIKAIKKVFQKTVNLIFLLPICMSNSLIELYAECDSEKKLKIWKTARDLALLSYKFLKEYPKSEDDPNSVFEIASTAKMFGVLNFLLASYYENSTEGSFLDDKELKELLTTPSSRFSRDNEFEGLFLAQILSGSIDQQVLLEIRLNYQIYHYRFQDSFKLIDLLSKVLDARITLLPSWLPDYFYSSLDLSSSVEEQHLSAKTKASKFADNCVLAFSTKNKTPVLKYLSSTVFSPNSMEIIDKILASLFSCLAKAPKDAMIQENEQLSWCLSHIVTIVDTHFYMIPYILKKTTFLNGNLNESNAANQNLPSERSEMDFLELILTVAFTYQPLLVESVIQVLIKNGEYIFAPSSQEPQKPVFCSTLISLEVIHIIRKALQLTLSEFNKNPTKMSVHTFNNYFKLLQALTCQITPGIKRLPEKVKDSFKRVIEDISKIAYAIFSGLLFENDKIKMQIINFRLLMNSLQGLFEAAYSFSTIAQMNWKKQYAFILTKLDALQGYNEPQKYKAISPSSLMSYFESEAIDLGMEKNNIFLSSTKRLNWSGFDRRSESNYYESFDKTEIPLDSLPDLSKQIKENINKKLRLVTAAENIEDFYSTLGGDPPMDDLASSVESIESSLLPYVKEKQFPTSNEGKNLKAQAAEEKNVEEDKQIENVDMNDGLKSQPVGPQDKTIVESLNVPKASELVDEPKNLPTEDSFSDTLNIGLHEEIFEMGKERDMLELNCQEVCHLQKRFFERLLTSEARYHLAGTVLQIKEIMNARRDFLKEYLQSLSSQYLKLFWLFLPQHFKELIKSKLEGDDELYMLCYDTIKQVLELDNLHQYTQIELFDALNYQFSNRALSTTTNEKNTFSSKKWSSPKQVIEYNEIQEAEIFTVKKKFFEDPEMIDRALTSLNWLELNNSEMEKLVLFCACKNRNKITIPDLFLLNLINELRFIASLLELLEDKTLEKFQKLTRACNQEIKLKYSDLAAEIISFLADGLPVHVSSLVSLKVPKACLKKYVLPVLKSESGELEILTIYQKNGFERLISLLFDSQIKQKQTCVRGIIRLATNYMDRINSLFVVKDPNYYELGQYHHQMISIETAEKCWYFLVDIVGSNNQSDREYYQKFYHWSRSLFKSYSFFNALKHEFLYIYLNHFNKAKEQLLNLLTEAKKTEKPLAAFQAHYESDIKPLNWLTDLFCESIISQFKGITSRKDYREKNEESKGVLSKWSLILEVFVNELINSKDFVDLMLSAFEIICLESKKTEQDAKSVSLTELLFKLIVQIEGSVILLKEIAVSEKVPSWRKLDSAKEEEDKDEKLKELIETETQIEQLGEAKDDELDAELPDLSLHKYVSTDLIEAPEVLPISLTFTEINDSRTLLKLDEILLHALMRIDRTYIIELLSKMPETDFSKILFCAKFSFLQNLAQKERNAGIREVPSSHKTFEIDRKNHLQDSVLVWATLSNNERAKYKPKISYKHESGIDAGGLLRSWFVENTKILFSPSFGLFKMSHDSKMIHPSPTAKLIPGYLTLFEYAGYHVAMAIRTKSIIDVHFTKSFYKIILDRPLTLSDLEEVDSAWHSSLRWILENDIDDLFHTFSYEIDLCGERHTVELMANGSKVFVTNENKELFVKLVAVAKMRQEVSAEINAFLLGFNTVLQTTLLNNFMPAELEAIIAGASKISVEDLKQNTNISQYNAEFQQWLWEILEDLDQNQLSAFLYYVSGSTKVPFGGFKEQPIEINYRSDSTSLPVAHTCNRSLDLPEYSSKEILKEKLLKAMYEASGAFHIC